MITFMQSNDDLLLMDRANAQIRGYTVIVLV
jgi:hypothetical protein